jgi:hypothetical protein
MKFVTALSALAVLPAVLAAPSCKAAKPKAAYNWTPDNMKGDGEKDFPFCFTSTYQIIATPDQVVNANNTATPGEPGAVGYYNYGIQSDLDLICWVSSPTSVLQAYIDSCSTSPSRASLVLTSPPPGPPPISIRPTRASTVLLASLSPTPNPLALARRRTRCQWVA